MNAAEAAPLGETLEPRQKWLILFSLMITLFIGALDQTVVATAIPTIVSDLGGFSLLSWLFTSYMLSSTVVVPLTGKLSDIFGRKPFLLGGIGIFMLGSVLCGAAPNMESLIAFRAVQGIGGGIIFSSVFATVGDIVTPAERGKYIGMFTGTFSLASILGPTLGGLLTDHAGWRWIFYLNIPVGLIAVPAVWFNLPMRRGVRRPKIDFLGAFLLSVSSVALLIALVWAGDKYAWGSAQILSLFAGSAVFLAAFLYQETRHPEPIVPLHLFRNRVFLVANLVVFTLGMGMFGSIAYLPTFVQTALQTSATASGVITTPQSLGVLVASIIGGQLIARTGRYRWQTAAGAALVVCSMALLATVDVDTKRWHISAYMVVLGVGFGLVLPTMSVVVQNSVPYHYLGVASSSSQFFRQIGGVLGVAIFGVLLANSYHSAFADEVSNEAAARIPADTFEKFDDPTLAVDRPTYALVQRQVLALPGGEQLLADTTAAQREAIAIAIRRVFLLATGIAIVCLVMAFFLRELPLRRDFKGTDERPAGAPTGPPRPDLPEPARGATTPGA